MTTPQYHEDAAKPCLILDVRPAADFETLHRAESVNIPLEELTDRIHELPPRDAPLQIYDQEEKRARQAQAELVERERLVAAIEHGTKWLESGPIATGPSHDRLWQPHKLVKEAVALIRDRREVATELRALDIACGTGRDAVYLALQGINVDAWDILPDALSRCRDLANRTGVRITTHCHDVERDPHIEKNHFNLICCFNFLHRPLMPMIAEALPPGGLVVYETFVVPQREMFGKPSRDSHVLRPGELPTYFPGWEILISREGLTGPRRFAASLIARKPG